MAAPKNGNPVAVQAVDGIALVLIDGPPVNALSHGVRVGLIEAFGEAEKDTSVRTIVLTGTGRNFVAGADIGEMDRPPQEPQLPAVIEAIVASTKPVVAALNGNTLGGGLEIALACDFRIAAPTAILGLPEVNLGLIPGAGATQRLPRLIGIAKAAELIAGGRIFPAKEALALGIIDAIAEVDLMAAARSAAETIAKCATLSAPASPADQKELDAILSASLRRAKSRVAVKAAVETVALAGKLPLAEGLKQERATFVALRASPEAAALRYLFKAERDAAKVDGLENVTPRKVERIAIIGGGTMGSAIAVALIDAKYHVTLIERDAEAVAAARTRVAGLYDRQVGTGRLSQADAEQRKHSLNATDDWKSVAEADLVIEAVFEDTELKHNVFERLGKAARPGAVLATNTSYGDVDALAAASGRPADVIGLHFFAPAHVMRLVEIVRTKSVAPAALAAGLAVAKRMRKLPVIAGNAEGFIGNRIFSAYRRQLEYLLVDGAWPDAIDAALEAYGFAMGPFKVFDLSGLEIAWAQRKKHAATRDPKERYVAVADRLCERGWFGRKSGRGWYRYEGDRPIPDMDARALIEEERRANNITPRSIGADEIVAAALSAMASEAKKLLAEGIAARPSDVDLVMVNGYGFPAAKGGPLYAAGAIR